MKCRCSKCNEKIENGGSIYHWGNLYHFCHRHFLDMNTAPWRQGIVDEFLQDKGNWISNNIKLAKENVKKGISPWN